jgi:hypothetical protein
LAIGMNWNICGKIKFFEILGEIIKGKKIKLFRENWFTG